MGSSQVQESGIGFPQSLKLANEVTPPTFGYKTVSNLEVYTQPIS